MHHPSLLYACKVYGLAPVLKKQKMVFHVYQIICDLDIYNVNCPNLNAMLMNNSGKYVLSWGQIYLKVIYLHS